jgi:ABC-2 type transport system ATP-binding protein
MSAIQIHQVTKFFHQGWMKKKLIAVNEVSMSIETGEVFGLIGPNGSGKSTLMKLILGLLTPSEGEIAVMDQKKLNLKSISKIGFLPENPYFYKHLTGAETLRFYAKLSGLSASNCRSRIDEMLKLTQLHDSRDRLVSHYSKGMLIRLGIAQALIHNPSILILDEPTAGVDPIGALEIRDIILKLKQEGKTILITSHLLNQLQIVCDRIGLMNQGCLILQGSLKELLVDKPLQQLLIKNASAELILKLKNQIDIDPDAELLEDELPANQLENLYINTIRDQSR